MPGGCGRDRRNVQMGPEQFLQGRLILWGIESGRDHRRHKSTITRELDRNSVDGVYKHKDALALSQKRRSCGGRTKLTADNWTYVRVLLYMKWSPEQISGWLKTNPGIGFYVSDEWIYDYVRKNRAEGGDLYAQLRRGGRLYNNSKHRPYRGKIKDRKSPYWSPIGAFFWFS